MAKKRAVRWAEPKGFDIDDPAAMEREAKKLTKWYGQEAHSQLPSPYGFRVTSRGNLSPYRETDNQPDLVYCLTNTQSPDDETWTYEWEADFSNANGEDDVLSDGVGPPNTKRVFAPSEWWYSKQEYNYYLGQLLNMVAMEEIEKWNMETWRVVDLRWKKTKYIDISTLMGISVGRCYNIYTKAMADLAVSLNTAGASYNEARDIFRKLPQHVQ